MFIIFNWYISWCTRNWKKKKSEKTIFIGIFIFKLCCREKKKENLIYVELFYMVWIFRTVLLKKIGTHTALQMMLLTSRWEVTVIFTEQNMLPSSLTWERSAEGDPIIKSRGTRQYWRRNWHILFSQIIVLDDDQNTSLNSVWHLKNFYENLWYGGTEQYRLCLNKKSNLFRFPFWVAF